MCAILGVMLLIVGSLNLLAAEKSKKTAKVDSSPMDEQVDWQRYMGRWYEIARKPHFFERGMTRVVATYTMLENGKVSVLNEGYKANGKFKSIRGKARTTEHPAQLKVTFFLFPAEYNILELGEEYEYAVVGGSNGNFLWILSRTPSLPQSTLEGIYTRLILRGYDLSNVERVEQ